MRKLIWLVGLVLLLTGCSSETQNAENNGSELRIVAAAAGAAEILQEIGLTKEIVGVDERNSWLSSASVVTSGHNFNFESLIALQPSHVVLDTLTDSTEVRDRLSSSGINIVELPTATSIPGIYEKYTVLGKAFNREDEARIASQDLQARFADLEITTRNFRIAFLYLRGTNAIYFVGGKESGADSLITAIGSTDVGAQSLKNPFSPLTAEVMRNLNPEVLLLMTKGYESVGGLKGLKNLPGLAETEAVKQNRVVVIDDRALLDFGPQTISVLQQMQEQLRKFDAA